MRRTLTALCVAIAPLATMAQDTPFLKYDIASPEMEQVFLDHVEGFQRKLITNFGDQYVGQVDKKGNFYGYGRYVKSDGSQVFGKFRNGELISGITLGKESALVGGVRFYSSYSLSSGQLEFVYKASQRILFDTKALGDYRFVSMRYSNGDQYIGETYQGKRHGLGLYFYRNGDVWFGEYDNNVRRGFGALFEQDNSLTIGQWEGEDIRRVVYVKRGK